MVRIMRTVSSWTLILILGGVKCALSSEQPKQSSLNTGDLFLTPLIDKNETEAARNKSLVQIFKDMFSVYAYSGFITINKPTNSNLFFLLTVAEGNKSDAPLLLWTQGGPGLSALFGQFLQNGPVAFNYTPNSSGLPFTKRINTLQKHMSVIYLDLPVGAGFSFTENETAYATTLEEISFSVTEFLKQFLKLFPWYVCRAFYVAGESYAARYSVGITHRLLTNESIMSLPLILKGTIGGNGFLGPILDTADSRDFLYQTSMLDRKGYDNFSAAFQLMRELMKGENRTLIPGLLLTTLFADLTRENKTLFQILTSYNDHASPLYTERPYNMLACFAFLKNNSYIRRELHIEENRKFEYFNLNMVKKLAPDYLKDISPITEHVLNESDVLLYTGQLDALFPSVKQRKYYARLNWTLSKKYRSTPRIPWRPHTWNDYMGYAGFIKQVRGFTEAMILGMSHYGAAEKPDEIYYLMLDFIFNWTRSNSLLP